MDHLRMHSADLTARNIDQLAELFPAVVTETRDEHGEVKRAVDFDLLRQELSDHVVDGPQERYQLDWPGKREALFAANAPIAKTLRPQREESVDFDTTKNLFIEGDNLEALKLLQESYLGKIKLIYIDPPYNTGHDFVYNDSFAQSSSEYLERSGQKDESGAGLKSNPESNGRFHSDWLSMMYARLKLARSFLANDGIIFISISSGEIANLRGICDEIFGSGCHKNTIAVRRGIKNVQAQFSDISSLSQGHEYILMYSRNPETRLAKLTLGHAGKPGKWDTFWRGTDRHTLRYELLGVTPDSGQWRWAAERARNAVRNYTTFLNESSDPDREIDEYFLDHLTATGEKLNFVRASEDGTVQYYVPPSTGKLLSDNWMDLKISGSATDEFDTEKSVGLLSRIINWCSGPNDIIMDFFAGSATTGEAVFALNRQDGGSRQFILVQIADKLPGSNNRTLADVARDRLRATERDAPTDGHLGGGFRSLRIDTTNMADTLRAPDALTQGELTGLVDNVKPDRSGEDLLFQVMLDWGLELSLPIAREEFDGREVFSVDGDALLACFSPDVTPALVSALAARKPLRIVFRDSAFATDSERINAEQVFAEVSPSTDVKVI